MCHVPDCGSKRLQLTTAPLLISCRDNWGTFLPYSFHFFFLFLLKLPHPLFEGLSHPFAEKETQKNLYCVGFYVPHFLKFLMGAAQCLIRSECTTRNFNLCWERAREKEKAIKVGTNLALFLSRQHPVQDGDGWTLSVPQARLTEASWVLFSEHGLSECGPCCRLPSKPVGLVLNPESSFFFANGSIAVKDMGYQWEHKASAASPTKVPTCLQPLRETGTEMIVWENVKNRPTPINTH